MSRMLPVLYIYFNLVAIGFQTSGGNQVMGVPVHFLYLHDCDPHAARAIYQDPQR